MLRQAADTLQGLDITIARDGACLTIAQQQELLIPVTATTDVMEVVKDLPVDKSPGIDGFNAEFFKTHWEIIGTEVTEGILQFFKNGKLLKGVNITTVKLVPKVQNATYVKEYRPIACCTTLYKKISKLITNKLKAVVDYIVSPSESALISIRNIIDNVIIAHELVKGYSQKWVSPRCTIKVDIRKAYDSVKWPFLRIVLLEFGLPTQLVILIMEYVTTVQYTLLINGGLTTVFPAKKGLRQGDPMSPLFFILVMEYLHRTLQQLRHNPQFNYHPRCNKLGIIHICFADDLLMSCRADEIFIKLMFEAFHHFSAVSGLQTNIEKKLFIYCRSHFKI